MVPSNSVGDRLLLSEAFQILVVSGDVFVGEGTIALETFFARRGPAANQTTVAGETLALPGHLQDLRQQSERKRRADRGEV